MTQAQVDALRCGRTSLRVGAPWLGTESKICQCPPRAVRRYHTTDDPRMTLLHTGMTGFTGKSSYFRRIGRPGEWRGTSDRRRSDDADSAQRACC